jgi:SAM-dependent methyltransferase
VSTLWAAGRYESVAERIAAIAVQTVDAADRRRPIDGATVLDLAAGTGSAAIEAASRRAAVTAVDVTAELLEQAAAKARAAGHDIEWVTADAADTRLPAASFDAVVSNMGVIFVDPQRQVPELARLLKPGATLAFSSWVRDEHNPFFDPIVAVLGAPPAGGFSPDQWGDPDIRARRLEADFTDVDVERGHLTWKFPSMDAALHFLTDESPMHVAVFARVEDAQRERLLEAFRDALGEHADADGVRFDAPYVVVTAQRR